MYRFPTSVLVAEASRSRCLRAALLAAAATLALTHAANAQTAAQPPKLLQPTPPAKKPPAAANGGQVVVTASRVNLLGKAETASQGSVTAKELQLRPVYRVGQLLETTPGLVVTVHSGEGKANQYLLRGFNLDHGTDIANFIDDMPINRPSNAHGQGYSDVNFFLPQMAAGLDFTKGPYYAAVGDFGAVASTHVRLQNEIPTQVSVTGGTIKLSDEDRIAAGGTYDHVNGPFDHPDNFRKYAANIRYSHGVDADGYSATLMYYKGDGNFTTDQPVAALQQGLIDRFGTLDPADGNSSERLSLSAHYAKTFGDWAFRSNAYYIHSNMVLWNNFTHFLDDQTNGDQEEQDENRSTMGGALSLTGKQNFGWVQNELTLGLQYRHDDVVVDRRHTKARQVLDYCATEIADPSEAPAGSTLNIDGSAYFSPASHGNCQADRLHLNDLGVYAEDTVHWLPWLRTVVGLREEYYAASDQYFGVTAPGVAQGTVFSGNQTLFQPKGSIIVGPFFQTELYLSAGRGFHSDDVRGVFGTVPQEGIPGLAGKTPFMQPADGEEVGVRTNIIPKVQVQVALFQEDFKSELAYDADAGEDSASAPSRRQGVEFSAQYRPWSWLELNTDLAFSKARYNADAATLANFGLDGPFIANAPSFIGSFGVLLDKGPWFAGLQWRDLGPYPISDGDENPQEKGYSEFNANVGYRVNDHLTIEASGFNLLNSKADSAGYDYTYRLTPTADAEDGPTFHPLEPISGQVQVTWTF